MRAMHLLAAMIGPCALWAQEDGAMTGTRAAGMGYAVLAASDVWSARHNVAGLAGMEKAAASVFFQPHFLSQDLAHQGLVLVLPIKRGVLAADATSFGFALYSRGQVGAAYSLCLSKTIRAGVRLGYQQVRLGEGYGRRGVPLAQVGVQANLSESVWAGVQVSDPHRPNLGAVYDQRIPSMLRFGLGWQANEELLCTIEVEKTVDREERFRAGMEYKPHDALYLRMGLVSGPATVHGGVGLHLEQLEVDLAIASSTTLGTTPQIGLNYRFP
jgi:hypothetical protein